jgi:hypothetical protein
MTVTSMLPLPSGDHEGLEGFRVIGRSGEPIGVVAAVERIDGALLLVIESPGPSRAYRTVPWSSVARVDVGEETVCVSETSTNSVVAAQQVRRVSADTDEMVRYLPIAKGTTAYASEGTEPSKTRVFLSILIISLATPAILAAGGLATAGNSRAGWIFLAIALALLSGGLLPWLAMGWAERHRRRAGSAKSASR